MKTLKFRSDPPFKTHQYTAYALGAILAHAHDPDFILNNKYIQLESGEDHPSGQHVVRFSPFIGPSNFQESGLGFQAAFHPISSQDLLKAVRASLENEFFVRLLVDEYFVPDRWNYLKVHKIHDILILGYDSSSWSAEIAGYGVDGRYKRAALPFQVIANAFFSRVGTTKSPAFIAFKYVPIGATSTNIGQIIDSLEAFLVGRPLWSVPNSANSQPTLNKYYGLDAFDEVSRYLDRVQPGTRIDRRPFQLLSEHAHGMINRAARILSAGDLRKLPPTMLAAMEMAVEKSDNLKVLSVTAPERVDADLLTSMKTRCLELKGSSARSAEFLHRILLRLG